MPAIVKRYPTTTIAAVVLLIGGGIASAVLISGDDAGSQRFSIVIGLITSAVTTLLVVNRVESGNETTQHVADTLDTAVTDSAQQTPAALNALRLLVEASERAERAARTIEKATNGHASGELHTRADDQ